MISYGLKRRKIALLDLNQCVCHYQHQILCNRAVHYCESKKKSALQHTCIIQWKILQLKRIIDTVTVGKAVKNIYTALGKYAVALKSAHKCAQKHLFHSESKHCRALLGNSDETNEKPVSQKMLFLISLCLYRRRNTQPICANLQEAIMMCYNENKQQVLNCSELVKEYQRCVRLAQKVSVILFLLYIKEISWLLLLSCKGTCQSEVFASLQIFCSSSYWWRVSSHIVKNSYIYVWR